MTKKTNTPKSTNTKKTERNPIVSLISTIITGILIIIAVIFTNMTGIDILGILQGTPPPPTATIEPTVPAANPGAVKAIKVGQGYGASKSFWEVYFTAPTGSTNRETYIGGIDENLAKAIDGVKKTLDIAAFEWNSPALTKAVVAAKKRGVTVRVVADSEHTIEDSASTISELAKARIPIIYDNRSAFMHNKFMILDNSVVWTGSTNFTINDVYRNNNNMLMLRSRRAVDTYQAEFNEMFLEGLFGPRSPANNTANYTQDSIPVQVYFGPENAVMTAVIEQILQAKSNVRFMTFAFTYEDLRAALMQRAEAGVKVEGVFELRGSETQFSQLRPMYCAGLDVRQDGNSFTMHHKVFIIDNHTVITGSFNFSQNAVSSNDENLVIIRDPDLAAQYIAEYERVKAASRTPDRAKICNS